MPIPSNPNFAEQIRAAVLESGGSYPEPAPARRYTQTAPRRPRQPMPAAKRMQALRGIDPDLPKRTQLRLVFARLLKGQTLNIRHLPRAFARQELSRLLAVGAVERVGHGIYRVVDAAMIEPPKIGRPKLVVPRGQNGNEHVRRLVRAIPEGGTLRVTDYPIGIRYDELNRLNAKGAIRRERKGVYTVVSHALTECRWVRRTQERERRRASL